MTQEELPGTWSLTLYRDGKMSARIDVLTGRLLALDIGESISPSETKRVVLEAQKQLFELTDELCAMTGHYRRILKEDS